MFSEILGLGGWVVLSVPLIWLGLVLAWDQIFGERDVGANLIITGLTIVWAVALSIWL